MVRARCRRAPQRRRGAGSEFVTADPDVEARRDARHDASQLMSPMQEGILFHALAGARDVYVVSAGVRISGEVHEDVLTAAWQELTRRHVALRVALGWDGAGHPTQRVLEPSIGTLRTFAVDPRRPEDRAEELIHTERERGFALDAPLVRAYLVREGRRQWYFAVLFHHLTLDGWSLSLLLRELWDLYAARRSRAPWPAARPDVPFQRYVSWLRRDDRAEAVQFWGEQLRAVDRAARLPALTGGRVRRMRELSRTFPATSPSALATAARAYRTTPMTVLLAAWAIALSRFAGNADVVFGLACAGRPPALPDADAIVGMLMTTVPLRIRVNPALPAPAFLHAVQRGVAQAQDHQFVPLVEIHRAAGVPSGAALFDTLVAPDTFVDPAVPPTLGTELAFGPLDVHERTHYPLTIVPRIGATVSAAATYDANALESGLVPRLLEHFLFIAQELTRRGDARIADVAGLTDADLQQLGAWESSGAREVTATTVHELVEGQVTATPDAVAIVDGLRRLTYTELNRRANQLSAHLRARGVGPERCVAICLPRSPELIVSMLAVLKAGAAYVPIDPAYPPARRALMLEDARIDLLITAEGADAGLPAVPHVQLHADDWTMFAAEPPHDVRVVLHPRNLAYVLYTSGSSGRPKGVALEHASAVAFLRWATSTYSKDELAAVLAATSVSFDLAVFEIFAPLTCGGSIVLVEDLLDLAGLAPGQTVTLLNTVPSALTAALATVALPHGLRTVNLAGEALPTTLVDEVRARHPGVRRVFNLYGPTECTTYSTAHVVTDLAVRNVPIGSPIANTRVYLLDSSLRRVPIGSVGEVYLGGAGVARGYVRRPDLTAARFLPDPFDAAPGARMYRTGDLARYRDDGLLMFIGRNDAQVKVRGFRIELEEVEAVLRTHPNVREAAVVAGGDADRRRLIAYVTAHVGTTVDPRELRAYLREQLPEFMVPSAFVRLSAMPRTPSGKLDRRALRGEPVGDGAGSAEGEQLGASARALAAIWREVLSCSTVSSDDDFFMLGGHSLIAVRLLARIRDTFGVDLSIRSIFDHPVLGELAALLDEQLARANRRSLVSQPRDPPAPRPSSDAGPDERGASASSEAGV